MINECCSGLGSWDEGSPIWATFDRTRSCMNMHAEIQCLYAPTLARRAVTSSCLACSAGTYSAAGY
jgi:hypothetical protein